MNVGVASGIIFHHFASKLILLIYSMGRLWREGDWRREVSQQGGNLWGDEAEENVVHWRIKEKLTIKSDNWYNLKLNNEPFKFLV